MSTKVDTRQVSKIAKEAKDCDMKNKVKERMLLSCNNMAKEHLERIRLGRQGYRNENNK